MRHEGSGDTCCPVAWAVVTADGRFVTLAEDLQLHVRRLTPEGVQRVRDEIQGTGLFETDASFPLEPRPGATPPARGVGGLYFKVRRETRAVEVRTAPGQGADEIYFVPSPARTRLDRLSQQLRRPETWLPANLWADATARPYQASLFVLLLRTEAGPAAWPATLESLTAAWPFSPGPLEIGQTLPASAGPNAETTRCTVLTREDSNALRAAFTQAGAPPPVHPQPNEAVVVGFSARDLASSLIATLRPLLPDRASCAGEYVAY